jgi:2-isopropylmalate synthase
MHVDALAKCAQSYQHIEPHSVGNRTRTLVSSVSGRASLRLKAEELGFRLDEIAGEHVEAELLSKIKHLEHLGFQFEGADASVELLIRRMDSGYQAPFCLDDFHVLVQGHPDGGMRADASVKVSFGDEQAQTAADGNGPVNALDAAVRKALSPKFPKIGDVRLADYKVRILDAESGTAAKTRVLMTSTDGERRWSTVGCGTNIIEASWLALADAYEYALVGLPAACGQRTGR